MQETLSLRLPPELWKQILENLGSSLHRNNLHPLLTVAHIFYDAVMPIVYETIIIDGYEHLRESSRVLWGNEPGTRVDISRVHLLHATLESSPQLARAVISLIDMRATRWCESLAQFILPLLTNLRRLHITEGQNCDILALPPSIGLTHISTPRPNSYSPLLFEALIALNYRSLTFLRMEMPESEPLRFLPPSTFFMNELQTFASDCPDLLDRMVDIAPIKHLSLMAFCAPWTHNPGHTFSKLLSLKIGLIYPINAMKVLGQYFTSLRLLHVSDRITSDVQVLVSVEHLMTIASSALSYICFAGAEASQQPTYQAENLTLLWDRYPSLQVVDIERRGSHGAPVTRHFRDCKTGKEVVIRAAYVFEAWWEPLKDDIGYVMGDI